MLPKKMFTSWSSAVPSSAHLRLAITSLKLPTSWGFFLSQLWLKLEVWVSCNLDSTHLLGLSTQPAMTGSESLAAA